LVREKPGTLVAGSVIGLAGVVVAEYLARLFFRYGDTTYNCAVACSIKGGVTVKKELIEKINIALNSSISNGKYTSLFRDDLLNLWIEKHISPEVVLREIRVLEGLEKPLMELDGEGRVPIWFVTSKPVEEDERHLQPDTYLERSPSATKRETQFKNPPLEGLWHKHYYIHESEFLEMNVNNQRSRFKRGPAMGDMMAMLTRIAENKVTGEWVVFKRVENVNTYLCLANHNDGDEAIYERIKNLI
jgi:hypothetical protein